MTNVKKVSGVARPTVEDVARAAGYFVMMLWTVFFVLFPPTAFAESLDLLPRITWMSVTFVGAFASLLGALLRIDIKLELPGLLVAYVGPVFYFASQLFYVVGADPSVIADPTQRYALVVYAILPAVLLLPRTISLFREARRLKRINEEALVAAQQLVMARAHTAASRTVVGGK